MTPTVYVETTVISYLTAWPSRDVVRAGQQQVTRDWWATQRGRFDLVASELVIVEAAAGDLAAAAERLRVLDALPVLRVTTAATEMADALVRAGAVPPTASRDALHIAICAVHGVSYLLTWNFRHLANAALQDKIRDACEDQGYKPPVICAPAALSEEVP